VVRKNGREDSSQREALPDFLARHNLALTQLDEDQKSMLEEEFSQQEVKAVIQEGNEVSAPGSSGHSIAFFKGIVQRILSGVDTMLK
jgi:hypothetical protein